MNTLAGFVAWLLLVFLQTCPADRLRAGEAFTFDQLPQGRKLVITVDSNDTKHRVLSCTCKMLPESGKDLERAHHATMAWGKQKTITSFKSESEEEILIKSLVLPLQPTARLLLGSDPNYAFVRTKRQNKATPPIEVEGYPGKVLLGPRNYQLDKDEIDISTNPELGLLNLTFSNSGHVVKLQLSTVILKDRGR